MSESFHRKNTASNGHVVSNIFVFCMIGLFAILATTLTLTGIRAYRSTYEASARNTEGQIALSYLTNKIHAYDGVGGVEVRNVDGVEILYLCEAFDDQNYETRIFYSNGMLREYFCEAGEPFDAELGEGICDLSYFSIAFEKPWLFRVELAQPKGDSVTTHIALRVKGAETP